MFDDEQNGNVQRCADVCRIKANKEEALPQSIRDLLDKYSSYYKMKRAVAWLYKICKGILSKQLKIPAKVLSIEDLDLAEKAIVRCAQKQHFVRYRSFKAKEMLAKIQQPIQARAVPRRRRDSARWWQIMQCSTVCEFQKSNAIAQ